MVLSWLTVTNEILSVTCSKFPKIEDTFASTGDAVQNMVTQLVEVNRAFHEVKLQLQARTEVVNNSVNMLTMDIDNLCALHRNICKDDFKTSNYLELFVDLASCMHCHLVKTHNVDGEDLMDFRKFMRHSMDIVMKLDLSTHCDAKDWSGIFKELLTIGAFTVGQKRAKLRVQFCESWAEWTKLLGNCLGGVWYFF